MKRAVEEKMAKLWEFLPLKSTSNFQMKSPVEKGLDFF